MVKAGLKSTDPEVRRRVAASLAGPDVLLGLEELFALLEDSDWRVRREAALALARASDLRVSIARLLDAVEQGDVGGRNAAIEALRHIGPPAAPSVLERLSKAQGSARRFLIEVLADAGTEQCVAPLQVLLDDADPNVPPAAAESLGRIAGAAASEALRYALTRVDPVVRMAALQAFGRRGEALPWDALASALQDPLLRPAALRAAVYCDDPRALQAIVAALESGPKAVASEAVCAAARLATSGKGEVLRASLSKTARGLPALLELAVRGRDAEVRRGALVCLGWLGVPEGIGPVLAGTEVQELSPAAHDALPRFGPNALTAALESAEGLGAVGSAALLRWALPLAQGENRRALVDTALRSLAQQDGGVAAADVLAELGDESAAKVLLSHLRARLGMLEPSEFAGALERVLERHTTLAEELAALAPSGTRWGLLCAELLGRHGRVVAIGPVREALTSTDAAVRSSAVRALAATEGLAAREALEFALADEDSRVQTAAAEALGSLGVGTELLEQSLRGADARVRQAAVRALSRRHVGSRLQELLAPALRDSDAGVVLAALDGLGAEARMEDLHTLASHPDADVVAEVLVRLRERGEGQDAGALLARTMMEHPSWAVRLEAVRSLHPRADRELLEQRRLRERDELVLEAIEAVLASSGVRG